MVSSNKSLKARQSPKADSLIKASDIAENRTDTCIHSIEDLKAQLHHAAQFRAKYDRPFITVSYAQSIDGSIASRDNEPLDLSGPQSWTLTHQVRAVCDAILIGIGTVLADDPQLSVRRVEGKNPQPIILDTHLRTPLDAKCVRREDVSAWLINGKTDSIANRRALEKVGAKPLTCATGPDGKIDLFALMALLSAMNVNSVMVEGGARVITSFLNAKLVDQFIITIAPKLVGGLQVLNSRGLEIAQYLECEQVHYQHLGNDIIVWARPGWKAP
jgi:3,4-dihydroxy 2-butanone 4-phosphate synthase/GTP cyclohydrolase II